MNNITLFYRYCSLDKRHEYQIENENNIQNQWVWFYLGKYLKLYKNETLLPYLTNWTRTKKLGVYKINSAEKRARCISNAIKNHRKERDIK